MWITYRIGTAPDWHWVVPGVPGLSLGPARRKKVLAVDFDQFRLQRCPQLHLRSSGVFLPGGEFCDSFQLQGFADEAR